MQNSSSRKPSRGGTGGCGGGGRGGVIRGGGYQGGRGYRGGKAGYRGRGDQKGNQQFRPVMEGNLSIQELRWIREENERLHLELSEARMEVVQKGEELKGMNQEVNVLAEKLVVLSLEEGAVGDDNEARRKLEGLENLLREQEEGWKVMVDQCRTEISWLRKDLGRANQEVKKSREGMEERDLEILRMKKEAAKQSDRFRELEKATMFMTKHGFNGEQKPIPEEMEQSERKVEESRELEALRKQLDSTLWELQKVREQLKSKQELVMMTERRATVHTQLVEELQKETGDKDGVIKQLKQEVEQLKGHKVFLELRLKELTDLAGDKEALPRNVEGTGLPVIESTFSIAVTKRQGSSSATPKQGGSHSIPGKPSTSASSSKPALKPKEEKKSSPTVSRNAIGSGTKLGKSSKAATSGTGKNGTAGTVQKRPPWTEFRMDSSGGCTIVGSLPSSAGLSVAGGSHHPNGLRTRAGRPPGRRPGFRPSFRHTADPSRPCCCVCGKRYKEEKLLLNHIKYYENKGRNCGICHGFFNCESSLNRHMLMKHSGKFAQAPPPRAGEASAAGSLSVPRPPASPRPSGSAPKPRGGEASAASSLSAPRPPAPPMPSGSGSGGRTAARRDREPLQARIYRCAPCAKFFNTQAGFNIHRSRKHFKPPSTTVTATAAVSKFVDRYGKEHGLVEEKPLPPAPSGNGPAPSSTVGLIYRCLCGKQYTKRGDLITHMWFGRQRGIFKCSLCPPDRSPFKIHNELKMHVMNVHEVIYGDGRFACCICAMTFPDRVKLAKHRRAVHGKVR